MRRAIVAVLAFSTLLPVPSFSHSIVIKPGETLSELAERHKVSIHELMQINGIKNSDKVKAGNNLQIPIKIDSGSKVSIHKVSKGETINTISNLYKINKEDSMLNSFLVLGKYFHLK